MGKLTGIPPRLGGLAPRIGLSGMQTVERLRGRRGVEQRRRRLEAEPLCRMCLADGRVTAATVPDHEVPLALGGSDDDRNIRCLCAEHHAEATAGQFGHRQPGGGSKV